MRRRGTGLVVDQEILPIDGLPDYGVSADGRVWRIKPSGGPGARRKLPYELKQHADRDGYRYVILFEDGERRKRRVHRLVLTAFVGPAPEGMVAAHNDGDPANNDLKNLRWDSQANNISDKTKHGTVVHGSRVHCAKLDERAVKRIRDVYSRRRGKKLPHGTLLALKEELGVSDVAIRNVANGKTWRHV